MLFETKLEELVKKYTLFPESQDQQQVMANYLQETFQARKNTIEHHKAQNWRETTTCKMHMPAPGLGTYSGMSGIGWKPESITYQSKNHNPALPPAENGWLTLDLLYKQESGDLSHNTETLQELRISWSAFLNFPDHETHTDKNLRVYRNKTENGSWYATWGEDLYAHYQTKKEVIEHRIKREKTYTINIAQTNRGGQMTGIGFTPQIIKNGTLADFFKDLKYQELDRLF